MSQSPAEQAAYSRLVSLGSKIRNGEASNNECIYYRDWMEADAQNGRILTVPEEEAYRAAVKQLEK